MITDNCSETDFEKKIIGPFDCIKKVGMIKKPFQISFIKDSSSFFVEFYED